MIDRTIFRYIGAIIVAGASHLVQNAEFDEAPAVNSSRNVSVKDVICHHSLTRPPKLFTISMGLLNWEDDDYQIRVEERSLTRKSNSRNQSSSIIMDLKVHASKVFDGKFETKYCTGSPRQIGLIKCNCNLFCLHLFDMSRYEKYGDQPSFLAKLELRNCRLKDRDGRDCMKYPARITICPLRMV